MKPIPLLAALILSVVAASAAGEVYKWVDQDGKVHYGDRRPASGVDPNVVELAPAPSKDADHDERSLQRRRLLDAFEAERAEQRQAQAKAAAAKRDRAEKCARVRRDLARFERANIVYTEDDDGTRIYMSDAERNAAVSAARTWLDEHCR